MKQKKIEKLLDYAELNDGYVSVAEAKKAGIAQTYLCQAEEAGLFQKVSKGLYVKKGVPLDPYFILHFRYRKAVFCLQSALYLHGFDLSSSDMEVRLPINYMTEGIAGAHVYHVNQSNYLLGLSLAVSPHGPLVPTYDLERTILDVIDKRDCFSDEDYIKILDSLKDKSIDQEKLWSYAKKLKMQEVAEAVLKGRL